MDDFQSYSVKRVGKEVIFGCGAVRVLRNDIRIVANALMTPNFKKAIEDADPDHDFELRLYQHNSEKKAKAIILLLTKFKKQSKALGRIISETGLRFDLEEIMQTSPETLKRIAG